MQCSKLIASDATRALPVSNLQLPPLRESPLHLPEHPSLILLRRGRVTVHERNAPPELVQAGSINFYPASKDYDGGAWSAGKGNRHSLLELPKRICSDLLDDEPKWFSSMRTPLRFIDPKVEWWINEIESHCTAGEPHGSLYTEAIGMALLSYVDSRLTAHASEIKPGASSLFSQNAVRRMEEYIDTHIAAPLGICDLAAVCGYSPRHFVRVFKQSFGMPVHRFVIQRRIELARSMLQKDHVSLVEIANICGFSSQAHFNAAFKRHAGMTPGQYRNGG